MGRRKWDIFDGGGSSGVSGGGSEGVEGCRRARGIKGGRFCNGLCEAILEARKPIDIEFVGFIPFFLPALT